ncbi:Oidioi.mRNA.OKI2018_I69.PAR.g9136.t1.cds [Oikopleura dioica]|uniref:Oidioi.mRNA.OKI2018_I69.PAR.g9136.t1.cds n=1 Tax=Oikopleura dioica TaxID=34765 RepID=A0ABN7RMP3_OIKDI|nr:Oidioi.mRNA.OKI2018_I69.PAR.g9136.t1.cds [Oikopleura dioica]
MESGWDIIRLLGGPANPKPIESTCIYEKVTATAAYVFDPEKESPHRNVFYHQMTMDRVENNEYVLQNNQFLIDSPVIRISKFKPFFDPSDLVSGEIQYEEWYLLEEAYTLTLIPKVTSSAN